jgi:hypothetical protein
MVYDEVSPTIRTFVDGWEAFRKLGFRSKDIYLLVAPSARLGGKLAAFVALRTQGKEFNLEVGPVEDKGNVQMEYTEVSTRIANGQVPQADLDRMWQESECHKRAADFVLAVHQKGFEIPGGERIVRGLDRNVAAYERVGT